MPMQHFRARPLMGRVALAITLATALAACGGESGGDGGHAMPPPAVSVATPVLKPIQEWAEYSGVVEAVNAVEIRPRVGGYLRELHFSEGGMVKQGDLLFSIDDREYRAAVSSARADLARAEARLALARQELKRSQDLVAAKAVSQGEVDVREGELQQAQADRQAAQARVDQAELNLDFTRIRAPISGRIGAALIKPGNLLSPDQSLLTTLVSMDPIHVSFQGDERAYLARRGAHGVAAANALPVQIGLADESGHPHAGELDFVDNALDPATGTLRMRARLANPDGLFTPGLFARVRLLAATRDNAMLIHEQAIQVDQDHRYVYVIGDNNSAVRHDIQLGPEVDGLRVVESGLDAQSQVVVNGSRKIFFPGQPVAPRSVPMDQPNQPAPEAAPAAAPGGEG